ncbi:MAG: DUF5615 family PIN-like protein [Lewinellaceae bacterium]|nr:DUF5615 family PIN-like protein [Saprospiraceae bacterium]MCB9339586.1 DUF5615 family PIN-like protein [Lewinellaceae bacterium]
MPDEEILKKAHAEDFIVVTSDKDFGELVFKQLSNNVEQILTTT